MSEIQLLSSKTFGKSDNKCRRVRQLHCTPPSDQTHDTVFFALMDLDVTDCSITTRGDVALVSLDNILSSKSVGFSRCRIFDSSSSSSTTEVQIGMRLRQLLQEPSCQARPPPF
jgi:hypothetical protein